MYVSPFALGAFETSFCAVNRPLNNSTSQLLCMLALCISATPKVKEA